MPTPSAHIAKPSTSSFASARHPTKRSRHVPKSSRDRSIEPPNGNDVPGHRALRLGTRGSQLALWQAHAVADRIARGGGPACELVIIKTSGDHLQNVQLSETGGKRLFVKELEDALLNHDIDLAVHSSKDMPVVLPDGLTIAAVLPREDPRDALVLPVPHPADLGGTAVSGSSPPGISPTLDRIEDATAALRGAPSIGTGSVRRIAQLASHFHGARFTPIRGNLDTRLRKLDEGQYDALVLAAAGLRRLGYTTRISMVLPIDVCVPAPGQGIVAVETRTDDDPTRESIRPIDDRAARLALTTERAVVAALGGGCQTPIGALASLDGESIELVAVVAAVDGSRLIRARGQTHADE